jgi:Tfp pilus assembly protein PilV
MKNGGFSIVEVLVAGAILGIATIAVAAMIQKSGDLHAAGNRRVAAKTFLSSKFETIYRSDAYNRLAQHTSDTSVSFIDPMNGAPYSGDFHTTITLRNVNQVPYYRVALALAWDNADGTRDSIALTMRVVQ